MLCRPKRDFSGRSLELDDRKMSSTFVVGHDQFEPGERFHDVANGRAFVSRASAWRQVEERGIFVDVARGTAIERLVWTMFVEP